MPTMFQPCMFQVPMFQTDPCGVQVSNYGGVWRYGLEHWKRLRGELEEEEEPPLAEIASVVERIPTPQSEDDAEARILLRLELEAKQQAWRESYVAGLAAYREGYREAIAEARARQLEILRALRKRERQRRLAILLLLDS